MFIILDVTEYPRKGIEGGTGEFKARQKTRSSVHLELRKNTLLATGTASSRGMWLRSIQLVS